ncbi:ATP-grasp domain-containing protein [Streptomyces sp. NPDC004327]|uniref:ATP-grasp domain-containing protein n=1 Tax=unclassified Streptomyces TaxID=2593676 RepID=UPI0036B0CC37
MTATDSDSDTSTGTGTGTGTDTDSHSHTDAATDTNSHTDLLLISAQRTSTALLLTEAARRRGMATRVFDGRPADRVAGPGEAVHWQGGPLLADKVAGPLGLGLLEPPDGWLTELPREFTRRRITLEPFSSVCREVFAPVFLKPPSDKSFRPGVYGDPERGFSDLARTLPPHTPVLVSDPVTFTAEYRLFVLDGQVVTGSRYAVHGRLDPGPLTPDARRFGAELLAAAGGSLPSAVVVDAGPLEDGGWAVVEANMAWFAQCYAADPDAVLDVVLRAAGPRERVAERDRSFLRVTSREASG